jgi:hypothetical protein
MTIWTKFSESTPHSTVVLWPLFCHNHELMIDIKCTVTARLTMLASFMWINHVDVSWEVCFALRVSEVSIPLPHINTVIG